MVNRQQKTIFFKQINLFYWGLLGLIVSSPQILAQNTPNQKSSLESAILREINKARTNPIAYADWLESQADKRENLVNPANLNQAIQFLHNLQPLPAIQTSTELNKIAEEIAVNNQANNSVKNNYKLIDISLDSNNQVEQIMVSFLSNQTKQTEIFSNANKQTGIACNSSVKKCVIAYPQSTDVAVADSRSNQNNPSSNNPNNSNSANVPVTVAVSNPETNKINNNQVTTTNSTTNSSSTPSSNENKPQTVATTSPNYNLLERGTLEDGDSVIPSDGSLYDAFSWEGKKGDSLVITLESQEFDTYLAVQDAKGKIIAENDDKSEGNSNSGLSVVLPADGTYRFIINSYDPKGRGDYTISVQRK